MTISDLAAIGAARIQENRQRERDRRADVAAKLADHARLMEENKRYRELTEERERIYDNLLAKYTRLLKQHRDALALLDTSKPDYSRLVEEAH
jgi:hypothetical protein